MLHHLPQHLGWILQIGIDHTNNISLDVGKAGRNSSLVSEITRKFQAGLAGVGATGSLQQGKRVVTASVIDKKKPDRKWKRCGKPIEFLHQGWNYFLFIIAGYYNTKLRFGRSVHVVCFTVLKRYKSWMAFSLSRACLSNV